MCSISRGIRKIISAVVPRCLNSPLIYLTSRKRFSKLYPTWHSPWGKDSSCEDLKSDFWEWTSYSPNRKLVPINLLRGKAQHSPDRSERVKSLCRRPRQTFLFNLVLEVSCGHVNRQRLARKSDQFTQVIQASEEIYCILQYETLHWLGICLVRVFRWQARVRLGNNVRFGHDVLAKIGQAPSWWARIPVGISTFPPDSM